MKERTKGYINKLIKIITMPEMAILPSNIAFNIILAIIPLLTIVTLIASKFGISIDLVGNLVKNILPIEFSDIIIETISGKGFDGSIGFFNIIAILIASNGTYAIINTSDTLYKIKNKDYFKARISSLLILFIVIILFVFLLIVPVFGDSIISLMRHAKLLSNHFDIILKIYHVLKWPITILIIYFNLKLIYTVAPSKNIKSEETTVGATFTTIGWIFGIVIFKYYLSHFARYDIIYGNLASIIIMMVWAYFLSFVFVIGMAINVSKKEKD